MEHFKDIVFFDLETTGKDVATDRIVELSALKVDCNFNIISPPKTYRFNPMKPIHPEATAAHGITIDMVQNEPTFKQRSIALYQYLEGCNLAGYNIKDFDVPLLSEEFARCCLKWPLMTEKYFDSFRIFRIKEKRDLTAALKFYCNENMEGAHAAENDILATLKIMKAQINRYPDLRELDEEGLDAFCNDGIKYADIACKLSYNEQGVMVYAFGKSKGTPVKSDPGFGEWMLKNSFTNNTKEILRRELYGK